MKCAGSQEGIHRIVRKLIQTGDDLELHMKTQFKLRLRGIIPFVGVIFMHGVLNPTSGERGLRQFYQRLFGPN
ncbi:hypothetical protein ECG_06148 [Echinococcus granulosus]|uniref:Uncharacterized protein n=1 Tax=Echinococcus granulosus TaxID=6210 RepID=A0A068WJ76_ECHGR|nr:hypothetical protein ECG_06148 [Echinococcus granulosus]CDS19780.1 hypothetical protein EgrG_000512000 [Echinococcus granulosus]